MNSTNRVSDTICAEASFESIQPKSWLWVQAGKPSIQNILITDVSKTVMIAALLGCASRVILQSIPMVLVCDKGSTTPAIQYAEAKGYNIHHAEPNSTAGELLEPGDAQSPVATTVETGDGGLTLTQAGIILGRILEYVCYAINHPSLAILVDDLPSLGQVPHIENAMAMSRNINIRFCMTAEHMNDVAATYPATHIKIIENCKMFS